MRDVGVTWGQAWGVKVRARKLPSGRVSYQLDLGMVGGRRVQRSYDSAQAAERALRAARGARERHGSMAGELTGAAMAEIVLARERLQAVGASLLQAVDFFLLHGKLMKQELLLSEMVERFRDARERDGCSARYCRQLGVSLHSLVRCLPTRLAHEVSREEVELWLRSSGWSAKTRNNYAGDVRACFSWAVAEGFARVNPAEGIAKARLSDEEIGTLSVGQCEGLLQGARQRPEMMCFVVLGLLGGLRPAEIQRLDWSAIDLKGRTVIVAGSQAKTRRRRVVDLSAQAVAWLSTVPRAERQGVICGKWWDARWRMFRRSMGWAVGTGEKRVKEAAVKAVHGVWPHNALRHTYASMHYAMFQDEAKLQAQMGHESAAMLHRHYRALKTRAEALRFWALRP